MEAEGDSSKEAIAARDPPAAIAAPPAVNHVGSTSVAVTPWPPPPDLASSSTPPALAAPPEFDVIGSGTNNPVGEGVGKVALTSTRSEEPQPQPNKLISQELQQAGDGDRWHASGAGMTNGSGSDENPNSVTNDPHAPITGTETGGAGVVAGSDSHGSDVGNGDNAAAAASGSGDRGGVSLSRDKAAGGADNQSAFTSHDKDQTPPGAGNISNAWAAWNHTAADVTPEPGQAVEEQQRRDGGDRRRANPGSVVVEEGLDEDTDVGSGSEGEEMAEEGEAEINAAAPPVVKPLKPATQRRVDDLQIAKIKAYGATHLDLELQRQALELEAQQLVLREEVKRREQRVSRADALREDERLSSLPPKQVLLELATSASSPSRRTGQGRGGSGGITLDDFLAAHRVATGEAAGRGAGSSVRTGIQSAAGIAIRPKAAELLSVLRTRWDPEERVANELKEVGEAEKGQDFTAGVCDGIAEGDESGADSASTAHGSALPAVAPDVRLDDLVSALRHDVLVQEAALRSLKLQHNIATARLGWARRLGDCWDDEGGDDGDGGGDGDEHGGGGGEEPGGRKAPGPSRRRPRRPLVFLDQRGRELRQMSLDIIDEVLDRAMARIAARPSREQVSAEVAAWRATQPGSLAGVARHLAEGLTHEVVDELIAEAYDEICHLKKVADSFAFDMLVEAVAFSQRKYVFGGGEDAVRARLRDAAAEQDANLARSLAAKRAAAISRNLTRKATRKARAAAGPAGPSSIGTGRGGGGIPDDDDANANEMTPYTSQGMSVAAIRGIKLGDALADDLEEEAIYVMHREFNDTHMARDEKQLYLQGLKAMLQEMRLRRGNAPYGHTQQLSVYWPPYIRVTRAQRLAVQRVRPPLGAGPAVWRHLLREPLSRVPLAPWPGPDCAAAAQRERMFWYRVALRPTYLTVKNTPMAQVFPELGPITALSASPNGVFLAVGTAPGAMLVFNMRNKPVAPWFQVLCDGQTYKRPWFRREKPRNPALVAFAWSADSYQLASLDASSTLRMWWMRPEPGSIIKEDPGRQPVAPELILSLGPMSVAISGKAPVLAPLLEEQFLGMAASAGLGWDGAASAAGGRSTAGAAAAAAAAAEAVALSRKWALCLHPEFNIAGIQPTVMLPQVTGDIVRLTTTIGSRVLAAPLPRTRGQPPRTKLNQQTVDYLMPAQIRAPESRVQALLRRHDSHIVYVGVMADCASILSVDASGVICLWPTFDGDRTGYGWFRPRHTWRMPRTLRSYQGRGPLNPVWPRVPVPALRGIMYNPPSASGAAATAAATAAAAAARSGGSSVAATIATTRGGGGGGIAAGFFRGLFRRRDPDAVTAATSSGGGGGGGGGGSLPAQSQAAALPSPVTYSEMLADAGMLDDEFEPERLDELPLGDFLLESRQLWMVRFLTDRNGRLLREAIHRPVGPSAWEAGGGGGRPLVISTFTMDGELVRRAKQYVVHTQLPYRVVAAELTPSRRDLVVWCYVAPQVDDVDSFGYFSVHVLNVEEGLKPNTPRIEIYDHSRGAAPPAFAVSRRVPGLGSEYLIVGLAHGLMGFFSLSTGAIVRVVQLPGIPTHSPYFSCLSLFTISPNFDCLNTGKSFVAVVAINSTSANVYELDDTGGMQLNVRAAAAYAPPPGVMPPPLQQPILPSSQEPTPVRDVAMDGNDGHRPRLTLRATGLAVTAATGGGHRTFPISKQRAIDDPPPAAVLLTPALRPLPAPKGRASHRQVAFSTELLTGSAASAVPSTLPAALTEAVEAEQGTFLPQLAVRTVSAASEHGIPSARSSLASGPMAAAAAAEPQGSSANGGQKLPPSEMSTDV